MHLRNEIRPFLFHVSPPKMSLLLAAGIQFPMTYWGAAGDVKEPVRTLDSNLVQSSGTRSIHFEERFLKHYIHT